MVNTVRTVPFHLVGKSMTQWLPIRPHWEVGLMQNDGRYCVIETWIWFLFFLESLNPKWDDLTFFLQDKLGADVVDTSDLLPSAAETHNYPETWPDCKMEPPKLLGYLDIDVNKTNGPDSFETTHKNSPALKPGGHWSPAYCRPRSRVAIVIPYR